jgi:hypothetical protein
MENKTNDMEIYLNEAATFLAAYGIQSGHFKVPAFRLYEAYKAWSACPVSRNSFFRQLARIHQNRRSNNLRYYLLNISPVALRNGDKND